MKKQLGQAFSLFYCYPAFGCLWVVRLIERKHILRSFEALMLAASRPCQERACCPSGKHRLLQREDLFQKRKCRGFQPSILLLELGAFFEACLCSLAVRFPFSGLFPLIAGKAGRWVP
jgi:hypothetical protein